VINAGFRKGVGYRWEEMMATVSERWWVVGR